MTACGRRLPGPVNDVSLKLLIYLFSYYEFLLLRIFAPTKLQRFRSIIRVKLLNRNWQLKEFRRRELFLFFFFFCVGSAAAPKTTQTISFSGWNVLNEKSRKFRWRRWMKMNFRMRNVMFLFSFSKWFFFFLLPHHFIFVNFSKWRFRFEKNKRHSNHN